MATDELGNLHSVLPGEGVNGIVLAEDSAPIKATAANFTDGSGRCCRHTLDGDPALCGDNAAHAGPPSLLLHVFFEG